MNFIQNILWNSVEGFVEAGTRTAGGYAGDALIKAGDMIENSGRNVGNGIERRASNYGSALSGQTYAPSGKALPSTARKPALKRSNSSPAATSTKAVGPTSKTPIGAKKYPGGKAISGVAGTATKQITSGVSGAKSTAGGVSKGVTGGVTGGAQKAIGGSVGVVKGGTKGLPKPFPNNMPYGTSTTPSSATKKLANGSEQKGPSNLPKPYNQPAFPSTEKKTAVKPGQPKPFQAPQGKTDGEDKKPSYAGAGSKTPVRPQKYKPLERMQGTAEKGKVQHITV